MRATEWSFWVHKSALLNSLGIATDASLYCLIATVTADAEIAEIVRKELLKKFQLRLRVKICRNGIWRTHRLRNKIT